MGDVVGGWTLSRSADEAARQHAPDAEVAPVGFAYSPQLLTEDEEIALVDELDRLEFAEVRPVGGTAERSARHYGGEAEPMPEWLLPARAHAADLAGLDPEELGTVVIARYPERTHWQRLVAPAETLRYAITFETGARPAE